MRLATTATTAPQSARAVVALGRLDMMLEAVADARVAVVHAPAGYGKTTAMLYWARRLREQGRPVMWLAARAGLESLEHFTEALRSAARGAGLAHPGLAPDASVADLTVALAAWPSARPVLVVDDAQVLPAEALQLLTQIIAVARDALTVIIASRGPADLPLGRLRSLGFLVEITAGDLRFTLRDTAELVAGAGGLVDAEALQQLVADTEGWASGVVLASGLHHRGWREATVVQPTRLGRAFGDYFRQEILEAQDAAMRDFLVDTAILEELTPAACLAVTGRQDSGAMLEAAEDAGLFVEAVDPERRAFRAHPLFRLTVVQRLTSHAPDRACALHRNASRYYADVNQPARAIEHAKQSGDEAFLVDQLEAMVEPLIYAGYLYRVDELASELSWPVLAGKPRLLLGVAWRRIRRLAFRSAESLIQAAEQVVARGEADGTLPANEIEHLRLTIRHRRIMLSAARDEMGAVERESEALLADLGDDYAYLSCTLVAQLMSARRELYHFQDALRLEAETQRALSRPGSDFASIALKATIAPTWMVQGKVGAARKLLEDALALAESRGGPGSGLAALPALPLAELLYDCGELEQASDLVERHLCVARQWAFVDQLAAGYLVRARLLEARGDPAAALESLEEAHVMAIECGLERLRALVVTAEVRILVKSGNLVRAEGMLRAGDMEPDSEPVPTLNPSRRHEAVAVAWLRLEIQNNRLIRARKVAKRWAELVRRTGAVRSAVTFNLLLAEIAVLSGDLSEARRAVREAVALAAPAGWTQVFLDEGEAIGALLVDAYGHGPTLEGATDQFAARLVNAFRGAPEVETEEEPGLSSRLASRELDILTMVAGGLRNREIGDRLGLTEGTIKWYMQQIYDKLGVRRRPQAVMRARQLGLLVDARRPETQSRPAAGGPRHDAHSLSM